MTGMPAIGYYDTRKKPSGKHEARWAFYDPMLKQVKLQAKTFLLESTARQYARDEAIKAEEVLSGKRSVDVPITDAIESFLIRSETDEITVALYRRHLEALVERHKLETVGQLADVLPDKEFQWLAKFGRRGEPATRGGIAHKFRLWKVFVNHCLDNKWLATSPFPRKFRLPKSTFIGRPLSEDEFSLMVAIRAQPEYEEIDLWLRRWLILQRYTMARTDTIFDLTTDCFRANGSEMRIDLIKHQDPTWAEITHPEALAVARAMLQEAPAGGRLFHFFPNKGRMLGAFARKARKLGLKEVGPLRPHDACKVTQVTKLDSLGMSPGEISAVSNTSMETIMKHYIKPHRKNAFAKVRAIYSQTKPRPQEGYLSGANQGNGTQSDASDIPVSAAFSDDRTVV